MIQDEAFVSDVDKVCRRMHSRLLCIMRFTKSKRCKVLGVLYCVKT